MTYTKLLVPLDGSKLAEQSLAVASASARDFAATIFLSTVVKGRQDDREYRNSQSYLAKISESLAGEGLNTSIRVGFTPIASAIVQIARDE